MTSKASSLLAAAMMTRSSALAKRAISDMPSSLIVVSAGLICACCCFCACRVVARRRARHQTGRKSYGQYSRAVGDDDAGEDSYDDADGSDGSGSEFEDDEIDDVEWNSRVSAMTGGCDRKTIGSDDGKRGSRGGPSWRGDDDEYGGHANRQQRRAGTPNRAAPLRSAFDEGSGQDLGMASLPAIFKTPDGACAVDIPLAGVQSAAALIDAIVHLGSAMVDADISASTIKVHYAIGPGSRPRKLTTTTKFAGLRSATGIIVTPGGRAQK